MSEINFKATFTTLSLYSTKNSSFTEEQVSRNLRIWQNLRIFFSRTTGPISTKPDTKHPWVKGIQSYTNKDHSILKRRYLVIFSYSTLWDNHSFAKMYLDWFLRWELWPIGLLLKLLCCAAHTCTCYMYIIFFMSPGIFYSFWKLCWSYSYMLHRIKKCRIKRPKH